MGSSNSDSIAIAAKYRVRKQRSIIDEAVSELAQKRVRKQRFMIDEGGDRFTPLNDKAMILVVAVTNRIEIDADADANESTMTLFAPQNIKTMVLRATVVVSISMSNSLSEKKELVNGRIFTPHNAKRVGLEADADDTTMTLFASQSIESYLFKQSDRRSECIVVVS